MKFRTFYMYVAQFCYQNQDYDGAYAAYDGWLTYPATKKLVAGEPSVENDTDFDKAQVAYYACLAAYQGKNFDKVGVHLDEAMKFEKEVKTVRQLRLMSLLEQGDTANWIAAAREYAIDDEVVAQNLLAYYTEKKMTDESLAFADELLAADPNNKIANYSKGVVLFGQDKYVEALPYFEKSTEIDPDFTDAYYNAGVCCCNEGYRVNDAIGKKKLKPAEYDAEIAKVKDWYRKAEPFFLQVKELDPENPRRWASRLKTVYYITGEKDKEAAMEAYME